jgi:exopolysaccharide biosynthesis polyprenyl glycosylphosphotransferase
MDQSLTMVPLTLQATYPRDVRSPAFGQLGKAISMKGMRVITLLALDIFLLCLAELISGLLGTPWVTSWSMAGDVLPLLFPMLSIQVTLLIAGSFYKPGEAWRDYTGVAKSLTLGAILLLLFLYFDHPSQLISRSQFLWFWILSIAFVLTGRFAINCGINQLRQRGYARYAVFLITDAEHSEQAMDIIQCRNQYHLVGTSGSAALDAEQQEVTLARLRHLGVAEAFVSWSAIQNRLYLCWQFQAAGIQLHVIPDNLDALLQSSTSWALSTPPTLSFAPQLITNSDFWIKRILDFCGALLILTVFSPLYGLIALLIKLDSPGAVFFRQTRIGLHGQPFQVWKFRTMVTNADQLQAKLEAQNEAKDGILFKLKADPRITRVGKWLRQYSLDELPQIVNVLLGEMSFVGPRPLPVRDVEKFAQHHFVRHQVLPGITGLWQVSGRSDIINFEDVIQLDLTYIQNWSLWLDLRICLKTVKVVLQKTGAY